MIKDTLPNKSGDPEKSQKIIIAVRKLSNYCAQKQESSVNQVGGLVTRNISAFCL